MADTRPLATPTDLSEHLGIPQKTLAMWRGSGRGPAFSRIGRHIRYRWEDVDAWVAEQVEGGERPPACG